MFCGTLNAMELSAKKSLGQHFLNSTHVLGQIIEAAELIKGQNVLEIGPGTGILTKKLLENGAKVIAVEKDVRSVELLNEKFAPEIKTGQLTLISGDILELRGYFSGTISRSSDFPSFSPNTTYSLIANIPYYITGAILESFLESNPQPSRAVLLVQKEVADRIMARDGKQSILSVSVRAFGEPKMVAKVAKGAFTPPPTVDSAILAINNISNKEFMARNLDAKHFFAIVRAGFAHKRKYLIRNLEEVTESAQLQNIWKELSLDLRVRAEDLEVSDWMNIAAKVNG
jgi:16S rRNA (adenine1518-N6/adenine1519-N6)-dimethyltransferase